MESPTLETKVNLSRLFRGYSLSQGDRARAAAAGPTDVRQPRTKGSARDLESVSCNRTILPSLTILVVIMRLPPDVRFRSTACCHTFARATTGEVPILVFCPDVVIVMPGAAVLGATWNGAAGLIVFYAAAYCAVMIFLAKGALVELKGKFSEIWSQTWAIMAATAAMTVVVLIFGELTARMQVVDSPLVRLALFSFAGAATYGTTLFAIGSRVISKGAEVLGWILRPRRAES